MLEPVNTVLKAVRRLNLLRGDVVLVAGQGPIGLMFTRLLQLAGARVLATDLLASRLRLARKFGAKWTLNVGQASRLSPSSLSRSQKSETGATPVLRSGLDSAVIAVPSDAAVHQALQLVRGGGQVLLFAHTKRPEVRSQKSEVGSRESEAGNQKSEVRPPTSNFQPSTFNLQLSTICLDEKDLIGSYSSDFTLQAEVARLVFTRRLDVRPLITHHFPLAETAQAVALAAHPTAESLKILVTADSWQPA
jgi:L-iditol 2-dehydrogenase